MMKKYILLKEDTKVVDSKTVYRIKAIRNFPGVAKGDLGGYIQSEENLSHIGYCWILGDSVVYEDARVYEDAIVRDSCVVSANAKIYGRAIITDSTRVSGNAEIYGESIVMGENSLITGNSKVYGNSNIFGFFVIKDDVIISGGRHRGWSVVLEGNAIINKLSDYIVFKDWWNTGEFIVWTKSNNMWSYLEFHGTEEKLLEYEHVRNNEVSIKEFTRLFNYIKDINK